MARGNIASPRLLHIRDLVLKLQPVKNVISLQDILEGFSKVGQRGNLLSPFLLFPYLWAAASESEPMTDSRRAWIQQETLCSSRASSRVAAKSAGKKHLLGDIWV